MAGAAIERRDEARGSGRPRRFAGGVEFGRFLIRKYAAPGQKAHAFGRLERKAAAAPRDDVDDELGVAPVFELRRSDIERTAADVAEIDVLRSDSEIALR